MIVITSPTGQIGRQVVDNLLESEEELRVIARDPQALSADARQRVEVIKGSHGDAGVVDKAFGGAESVFWLTPPDPRARSVESAFVGFTRPAAEAFTRNDVRRVVGVSALGRGTPWADKAGYATGSLAMDDLIASSGVAYGPHQPLLHGQRRPPGRVDQEPGHVLLAHRRRSQAAQRRHPRHRGSGLEASARQQLERRRRDPAPRAEDLSFNDMSRIISEVLGKEVRFQQTTFEAYKDRFVSFGMSEAMAQGMTDMAWAKNEGLDNGVRRTPENSTPTSFRQWCQEVLKPAVDC